MRMNRRDLAGLSFGALAVAAPAIARADTPAATQLDRIVKAKTVRIGAVEAAPWYARDLKTNKWAGVVPDQAELVFGSIGVKVEYVPTEWGTAVAGLQGGRFDLMGAFIGIQHVERRLAVERRGLAAQPSRRLVLGPKGLLGQGDDPGDPQQAVGLLGRKGADPFAIGERLAWHDHMIDFRGGHAVRADKRIDGPDRQAGSNRVDEPHPGFELGAEDAIDQVCAARGLKHHRLHGDMPAI